MAGAHSRILALPGRIRMNHQSGPPPPAMERFDQPPRRRRRDAPIRARQRRPASRPASFWPGIAVVGLLLVTTLILVFNQQHSGDPLKVRRELRKF